MENDDIILTVPLVCKEQSDQRHYRIGRLLVIMLIVSNVLWASTWIVYWIAPNPPKSVVYDIDEGPVTLITGDGVITIDPE